MWYFITKNIFERVGSLNFLLHCNYNVSKLPMKLSKFHQQVLTAAKLCFVHNFSPHKTIIWNNECIVSKNKSLYLKHWVEHKIMYLSDLLNEHGQLLNYDEFLRDKGFPVTYREFKTVMNAIPSGITQLLKCQGDRIRHQEEEIPLFVDGRDITSLQCNNKHIRSFFHKLRKITPRGKSLWSSLISNISWKEAWRLTFKYVISNKVKEMQYKILHYIYPTNTYLSRFVEIDPKCEFCNIEEETIQHLFFECQYTAGFWRKI